MKQIRKILFLIISAVFIFTIVSCGNNDTDDLSEPLNIITDEGLKLELKEDGTYQIVECTELCLDIAIPESYEGVNITSIAGGCFNNCSKLTSISVPATISSLDEGVFKGCKNLTKITLPYIGSGTDSSGTFSYIFGNEVPVSLKEVVITGGESVAWSAFEDCAYITDITLPNTLKNIGGYAFSGCRHLKNIVIPDGVTSIQVEAFYNCSSLKNIVIPDSVSTMGSYILKGCTSIESITIPFVGSLDYIKPIAALFGEYDFMQLGTWTVPSSLKSVTLTKTPEITAYMFNVCGNVKTITVSTTLQKIEGSWYTLPYKAIIDIYYDGSMEQWNAIEKEDGWEGFVKDYTIHCTDGTISK